MKPTAFIGSSKEGLEWARAVQDELAHELNCTVWNQNFFTTGRQTVSVLVEEMRNYDFGIFVGIPEDRSVSRGRTNKVIRDNVLFELGLCLGVLGPQRTFLLVPESTDLELPSDLEGFNPLKFDANHKNKHSAVAQKCCNSIRQSVVRFGALDKPLPRQSLEKLSMGIQKLSLLIGNEKFEGLDGSEKFAAAYQIAHEHVQSLVESVWTGDGVVASLKFPDELGTELRCYYPGDHHMPERRIDMEKKNGFPESIPIKGSLAGKAYKSKSLQWSEDYQSDRGINKKLRQQMEGKTGSAVACPVFLDGSVCAVAKLDAEKARFFTKGDRTVETVLKSIANTFEAAIRLGRMNTKNASRRNSKA